MARQTLEVVVELARRAELAERARMARERAGHVPVEPIPVRSHRPKGVDKAGDFDPFMTTRRR